MKLKKSSLAIKLVILIVGVYAAITLVSLQSQIQTCQVESVELSERLETAEQETQRLQYAIDTVNTDESVEEIARTKLGLARPGEIIFHDVGK